MILVIFGILVALLINSWNAQRKNRNHMEEISASIMAELEESITAIIETIPKQQTLIDGHHQYRSID